MQNCFCFLKGLGKISQNTSFPWPIFSCMQRKSTFCPYMGKYESDKTHILSDIAQWPSWSLRSIRTHWKIRWNHNLVFFHFFIFLLKSWVRRFQAKMIIRMKKTKKKKIIKCIIQAMFRMVQDLDSVQVAVMESRPNWISCNRFNQCQQNFNRN